MRVGQEGDLLFPTFNWGFCSGRGFNYKETPSESGSLSKLALNRNDFIRTKHPIYSFSVKGKEQEILYELDDESGWGKDSLFAYFHKNYLIFLFALLIIWIYLLTFYIFLLNHVIHLDNNVFDLTTWSYYVHHTISLIND